MKTVTKTLAVISVAAVSLTLASCGDSEDKVNVLGSIESGKVTLGTKFDQPGLGLRNPDGSMTGLDVDVATWIVNHIAEENGWDAPEIEWRETPSPQRETIIKNGEVDFITATYSINKGRAESVDFAGPYLITHQALLVRADDEAITAVEDLDNGRKLCSVSGSTPAQKVKDALPGVQLQEYDAYSSCVEALANDKVDAITTDAPILYGYASQYPGKFKVVSMSKPDGSPYTDEYYGIGLMKGQQDSLDAINDALNVMYESGEFDKLLEKNLGKDPEAVEKGNPGDLSFLDK